MTTELIGQSLTVEQADGLKQTESPLAQRIRESAFRVAQRVFIDPRWVEARLRLEQPHTDFMLLHPIALDGAVRRAIEVIDDSDDDACELLATRFGL